jgi:biopolymer transport protein ExbB/TolQ
MIRFFMAMGPFGPILLLISIVILVLTLVKAIQVLGRRTAERQKLERGLDTILFWGVFSFVIGLLGQFSALYKVFNIILHAEKINPALVFAGLAESLTSNIAGMTVLLLSSLAWFSLRAVVRRRLPSAS